LNSLGGDVLDKSNVKYTYSQGWLKYHTRWGKNCCVSYADTHPPLNPTLGTKNCTTCVQLFPI